jgi:hypothetical protein
MGSTRCCHDGKIRRLLSFFQKQMQNGCLHGQIGPRNAWQENDDVSFDSQSEYRAGVNLRSKQCRGHECGLLPRFNGVQDGADRKWNSFSITNADLDESGSLDKARLSAAIPQTRLGESSGPPMSPHHFDT